jgi:hypothetical protein
VDKYWADLVTILRSEGVATVLWMFLSALFAASLLRDIEKYRRAIKEYIDVLSINKSVNAIVKENNLINELEGRWRVAVPHDVRHIYIAKLGVKKVLYRIYLTGFLYGMNSHERDVFQQVCEDILIRAIASKREKLTVRASNDVLQLIFGIKHVTEIKFLLNAGLIASLIQRAVNSLSKQQLDENTIVGVMVRRRIKSYTSSYLFLLTTLVAYILSTILVSTSLSNWFVLFIFSLIAALRINQKVLEYRIRKGYYGSNEYEAREIIDFVLAHADKTDFIDGTGAKRLLPTAEIVEAANVYLEGVVYV